MGRNNVRNTSQILGQNVKRMESDNHGTDEDDLPLFDLIKKIPGYKNTSMSVAEEWINRDEQLEFTDAAIVEMINGE